MTPLDILSISAIISTIGMFLCGIPICIRIYHIGDTKGTSGAPFLLSSLSCSLMLHYGIIRNDKVVICVNVIGCFLQYSFLIFYYIFTRGRYEKRRLKQTILLEIIFALSIEYITLYAGISSSESFLGTVCMILNISCIAAPLLALGEVIRSGSTESVPFPLCCANLLVSLQWFTYGVEVNDSVIRTPNALAICLSLIQLSLFIIYPSKKKINNYKLEEKNEMDI